jgi:Ca2+-transporting ATPase
LSADEVARRLDTDATRGLPLGEVARRLRQYGPNVLAETTGRPVLAIVVDQFKSLIVILLVAATMVAFALG